MRILLVSSEIAPFAKTGGLADVAGALPKELKALGCDIRVVLPLYKMAKESGMEMKKIISKLKTLLGREEVAGDIYLSTYGNGVPAYLIQKDEFYHRDYLYGTPTGDYPDNMERFTFLCRMALTLCKELGFKPDIFHCHDWQSGLIPAYLRTLYKEDPFFSGIATVYTIHNIAYQGIFDREKFSLTGLPEEVLNPRGMELWGKMNFMKAGIVYSKMVTTVSKKYSQEIQTPEYGCGLEKVLSQRKDDLFGIINGVDYEEWDPGKDRFIIANYNIDDLSGKKECKKDLLKEFKMSEDLIDCPLLGSVSRLTSQKGFDLLAEIMDDLMGMDVGFVLLGTGEQRYHQLFRDIARKYPGKVGICISYDNVLAHKIEAGSDMFLMPSRYEPCGLNQIYSLKYGTIPIVRATGGLDDTIQNFNPFTGRGNGFKFRNYSSQEFMAEIKRAVELFHDKKAWDRLMRNAMQEDFSWNRSVADYLKIYHRALEA